jgi:hypothetical protein
MKKKQQTLCYEGEGCANFKNPILCSDCERNFDNFNIQDRFRYADEIPRIDEQKVNFSLPPKIEITATENVFKKRKEEKEPYYQEVCSVCGWASTPERGMPFGFGGTLVCPECGSLVTSELVRNERRFYRCLKGCGWGSYTKPKKE